MMEIVQLNKVYLSVLYKWAFYACYFTMYETIILDEFLYPKYTKKYIYENAKNSEKRNTWKIPSFIYYNSNKFITLLHRSAASSNYYFNVFLIL